MVRFRPAVVVALVTLTAAMIGASQDELSAASGAAVAGAVERYDATTFQRLTGLSGDTPGDAFGTVVSRSFLVTAPGAAGGGRLFLLTSAGVLSDSASAADLSARDTSRLGESWGDLGHPPGTQSALVIGAPGTSDPVVGARVATPAAVIVEYGGSTSRFTWRREVRRVEGPAESAFGWRVVATDSQFPAASFNASFVVTAPLEARGRQRRAGAVYKFDTDTGAQLWKFRGQRAGEMAGYSLLILRDQNGDGISDVLVGAPGTSDGTVPGRVYILSGANGSILRTVQAPEGALWFGYAAALGSSLSALEGFLISAPATAKGKKAGVGAVYYFADFDTAPRVFQGKRNAQGFGISLDLNATHLVVGSLEGHKKANKDRRGSVTVLLPGGRIVKTLRGKRAGDHFGHSLSVNDQIVIGVPGAPPLVSPQ